MKNYLVQDDSRIFPKLKVADIGSRVTFYCESSGSVKWFFEKKNTLPTSLPIHFKTSLTINDIELQNAGFYFCYGSLGDNSSTFLSKAELHVYGELKYHTYYFQCLAIIRVNLFNLFSKV